MRAKASESTRATKEEDMKEHFGKNRGGRERKKERKKERKPVPEVFTRV